MDTYLDFAMSRQGSRPTLDAMAQTHEAQTSQLPTVGSVTRCPRCGAEDERFNRWPQTTEVWRVACSACNLGWQEQSAYSTSDAISDSSTNVIAAVAMALAAIGVLFFVYVVFLLLRDLFGVDQPRAVELGITLLVLFALLLGIAAIKNHSPDPEI
jgi:transposase-like protein